MATPPISTEEAEHFILLIEEKLREGHPPRGVTVAGKMGALAAAGRQLGIPKGGFSSKLAAAVKAYRAPDWDLYHSERKPEVQYTPFPDDDVDPEVILDHMEKRADQRIEHERAKRWFTVRINDDKPVGLCWFGDPHLGSNGCNIKLLRKTVRLCVETKGLYGANIGDTADNWGGRLVALYADNDTSKSTERRLARWFLEESGVPWAVWLHGNHEHMDRGFQVYLEAVNGNAIPMVDWRARFKLQVGEAEFRIDAAHNHKGHSMWNELHGQERAAKMSSDQADLYIAGDKHIWATKQLELDDGRVVSLARVRGFKFVDSYALHRGYFDQQQGAAVVTIFNPKPKSPCDRMMMFPDAEAGADYLKWLRR